MHYTTTLLQVDSLLHKDQRYITNYLHNQYDNKELLESTLLLKNKIKNQRIKLLAIVTASILLIGSAIYLILKSKQKQRLVKENYLQVLAEKENDLKAKSKKHKNNTKDIKPEIIQYILEKLQQFEEEKEFLNANLTQASLAEKWNTNTSYLSKIINTHYQMNFSQYLNKLRITYATDKIQNDITFRHHKINTIASELGYNNTKSFVNAFKAFTNLDPSDSISIA